MSPAVSITIDCSRLRSEEEFWAAYVQATGAQGADLFGRNLDAFWDALHGGPGFPEADEIRFVHAGALDVLGGDRFLSGLREIAKRSEWIRVVLEE